MTRKLVIHEDKFTSEEALGTCRDMIDLLRHKGRDDETIYKALRGLPELKDKTLVELVSEGVTGIWAQITRFLEDAGVQAELKAEYAPIEAVTAEFEQAATIDLNIVKALKDGLAKWMTKDGQLTALRIDLPVEDLKAIVPHKTKLETLLSGFEKFKVEKLKKSGVIKKDALPIGGRIELFAGKFVARTAERKKIERAPRDPNAPKVAGVGRGKRVLFAYGEGKGDEWKQAEVIGEASLGRSGVNLVATWAMKHEPVIKKANGNGWTPYEQTGDSFNFSGNHAQILRDAGVRWSEVKEAEAVGK